MTENENLAIINTANAERAGRVVALSEIQSPVVLGAMELWNEIRCPRPFPSRAEITPRRFAKFLPYVILLELVDGGADFECRVLGNAAAMAFGGTFHGMRKEPINRLQPGAGDVIARLCTHVARTRAMLPIKGQFRQNKGNAFYQEAIFFPLGPHGRTVDHVLGVGDYKPAPLELISDYVPNG